MLGALAANLYLCGALPCLPWSRGIPTAAEVVVSAFTLDVISKKAGTDMHPATHLPRRIKRYPPPRHALSAQSTHRHRPPRRDGDVPRRARAHPVRRLAVDQCRESGRGPPQTPPPRHALPLYAAIALLATSILTRHRALPLRATLPPLAGAAAFAHFLPHLSTNIRTYAGVLEDAHLLAPAHVHETGKAHSVGAWARLAE
ncbi:hypothetical protein B0H14DRAFT_558585 [Mycena olivaceomarginata]|nr:hypothetical protein B0H14DRAFT_558585 [Mycena olivaceomarginata]